MSWTNISKPTGTSYTRDNPQGRENYDQSDITYDSSITYYDGINPAQWTDISKPAFSLTWNDMAMAWNNANREWGSPSWININKPQ